jgi:hypothetical protein
MVILEQYTIRYDLKNIRPDIEDIIKNPIKEIIEKNNCLKYKQWLHNDKIYHIIKYNNESLPNNPELGLCRSIIFSDGKVNVFSPPKYIKFNCFVKLYDVSQCIGEEIIEGTMVNLFYDTTINKWEIATKTSVGCQIRYITEHRNFDVLFNEICEYHEIDLNLFDKKYMYSFVMQHPENRIILPIKQMCLYLISIYEINNLVINEIPREKYSTLNLDHLIAKLLLPFQFNIDSFDQLYNNFESMNCNFNTIGVMIKSFDGYRSKIITPSYKYIKSVRGNYNKLQFQYICLRRDNKVKEYLHFFPESKKQFSKFRIFIHSFTDTLFKNYVSCYIKKENILLNYQENFRTHMYNIHKNYLELCKNNQYIRKKNVIEYVNNLEPSLLMYSLNYSLREFGKEL